MDINKLLFAVNSTVVSKISANRFSNTIDWHDGCMIVHRLTAVLCMQLFQSSKY